MGQYYKTLVIDGNKAEVYKSKDLLKLMENAWIENHFVNAIFAKIFNSPKKIAWIGDYANDDDDAFGDLSHAQSMKYYEMAWGDTQKKERSWEITESVFSGDGPLFLVNHSKETFLDMRKYIAACTTSDGWCVSPLPILTACGNGRGGGDYRNDSDEDIVGTWAFDSIELATTNKGYEEVCYKFFD